MKRAHCLYRVSTTSQVENDDIPMQRQACHEFAKAKGWSITEEFYEKGVSGFKVSVDNRDVMKQLKINTVKKTFDVLLVFMFDRLGRRDDETPFVVEWFVKNGIEVWSVIEGEQRFEDHVDKLLNYIRYWQSSGESIKTSIRTRTRMEQLTKEGHYIGGMTPYGYTKLRTGRKNSHGKDQFDLVINPEEAYYVRQMFHLYVYEEWGVYAIASYLERLGVVKRQKAVWSPNSVKSIIHNTVYIGILHFGEARSEPIPALQIISNDLFDLAHCLPQRQLVNRTPRVQNGDHTALCKGLLYCSQCGMRFSFNLNRKNITRKDGLITSVLRPRYECCGRKSHRSCNGQNSYTVHKIDERVRTFIELEFACDYILSGNSFIATHQKHVSQLEQQCQELLRKQSIELGNLSDLKDEIVCVVQGISGFGSQLLSEAIERSQAKVDKLVLQLDKKQSELDIATQMLLKLECNQNPINVASYATFSSFGIEEQRTMLRRIIHRIYIASDGALSFDFIYDCTKSAEALLPYSGGTSQAGVVAIT